MWSAVGQWVPLPNNVVGAHAPCPVVSITDMVMGWVNAYVGFGWVGLDQNVSGWKVDWVGLSGMTL